MAKVVSHKEEVLEEMREKLQNALNAIGADASSTASSVCPVDTGRLKNSITWATKTHCNMAHAYSFDNGAGLTAIGNVSDDGDVFIGTNVEYAPYQEYGTKTGIPAKHFLQYGSSAHLSEYQALLEQYLRGE